MTTLRLRDVCSKIGSGATPRGGKEVYQDSGEYALIRSQNVYNDRFERSGLAYIGTKHAAQLSNVEVHRNDVLLNITGDSVARACQAPDDILPARVNQHVAIIRPDPRRLLPRFLRFYLVSPQVQEDMLTLAGSGATRNALTKGMIESFEIPDFAIRDQAEIADLLGSLEDKIDLNHRMNETLDAMARATFKDWFVDFGPVRAKADGRAPYLVPDLWDLFPDALDDEGVPVGWTRTVIGTIAEIKSGKRPPSKLSVPDSEHPVPVYGGNGISWYTNETLYEPPFLVTGRVGTLGTVFRVYDNVWVSDNALCCFPSTTELLGILYFSLLDLDYQSLNSGSTQPLLTQTALKAQKVVIGEESINRVFSEHIEPLFRRVIQNEKENRALADTRNTLLPKLMSGEIRLRDAEKVVEAVA